MEATKFRSQLSTTTEQAFLCLLRAEHALAVWRNKLPKATAKSEDFLSKLRVSSREAVTFIDAKITRFQFQLSSASKRLAVPVEHARDSVANTARKVRLETQNDVQKLQSASRNAAVFTSGQIARAGSNVASATKQVGARLQVARNGVTTLVKSVVDKPRKRRDARRAKENEVRNLLSFSRDAIVITDAKRRLVQANPRALDLFGISEFNAKFFTIDAFLVGYESLDSAGASPATSHLELHGKSRIRRLDGALQVAECHFVPEVLPGRQLYEFLDIAPYKITPFGFAVRNATVARSAAATQFVRQT